MSEVGQHNLINAAKIPHPNYIKHNIMHLIMDFFFFFGLYILGVAKTILILNVPEYFLLIISELYCGILHVILFLKKKIHLFRLI